MLYFKVSGRVLPLNTQTKALLISIILPALSCLSVIVTHLTMVGFNLFQASKCSVFFSLFMLRHPKQSECLSVSFECSISGISNTIFFALRSIISVDVFVHKLCFEASISLCSFKMKSIYFSGHSVLHFG